MTIAPTSTHSTQSMAPSCPRSDLRSSREQDAPTEDGEALRLQRPSLLEIGLGAGIAVVFLVFTHVRQPGTDQVQDSTGFRPSSSRGPEFGTTRSDPSRAIVEAVHVTSEELDQASTV
jgi:hypothetical protein